MFYRGIQSNPGKLVNSVQDVMSENWELIQERVNILGDPDLMPFVMGDEFTDETAEGCGFYGCVFKTKYPDIVFKITNDQSEAEVFNLAIKQENSGMPYPDGLAKCFEVFELPTNLSTRNACFRPSEAPVYVLWRENLKYLGADSIAFHLGLSIAEKLDLKHDIIALTSLAGVANKVFCRTQTAKEIRTLVEDAKKWFLFFQEQSEEALQLLAEQRLPSKLDRKLIRLYQKSFEFKDDKFIGSVARFYLDMLLRGVLVADVHLYNVGVSSKQNKEILVSDPGLSQFMERETAMLASEVPFIVP